MRACSFYLVSALMLGTCLSAHAATEHGLHKHDSSIASYNYSTPIQTMEDPGNAPLNSELDQAQQSGAMPEAGAAMPQGNMNNGQMQEPMMQGQAMPSQGMMGAAPQGIASGSIAPDFQLAAANGQVVSMKDVVAGKPALILFAQGPMASRAIMLMQKNMTQFQQLGINVVAISSQPMDSIARMGVSYPVLSDTNHYVAQQYGATGMTPVLYSVDASGKIVGMQSPSGNGSFDLAQATAPLRGGSQQATMAPQAPQGNMMAPPSAMDQNVAAPSADPDMMPPLPSPQAGGKVKYTVPPSSPDFKKSRDAASVAI